MTNPIENPAYAGAAETTEPMKGADIVIRCLELAGVETLFAYPGGQSIELHQSLSKSKKLKVILPRHEQGGVFAACGYARITGKTGVCMATSGPGATNLISGIADAYMDSIPMVCITGQVSTALIGRNAFQETDIIGITRPIVKHSFLILSVDEIPQVMDAAFRIANTGRPGPVVVDVPKNIQQAITRPVFVRNPMQQRYIPDHTEILDSDVEAVRKAIVNCNRPCIYAGGGIITSEASEELVKFADSYNIPVTTTLMGIGGFPQDNAHSLDWLGMHGTYYAN